MRDRADAHPWTSARNAFGVSGTDSTDTAGATGRLNGTAGNHGGMSGPQHVLRMGVDFKRGATVHLPVSNVAHGARAVAHPTGLATLSRMAVNGSSLARYL